MLSFFKPARRFVKGAVLGLSALALVACVPGSGGPTIATNKPVPVALLVPKGSSNSGDAVLAQSLENAAKLAIADLDGVQIDLRVYATAGNSATAQAVAVQAVNEGAKVIIGPVFAEAERDSLNISAETLAPSIGPRTRGLIAVHTYGHPCRMAELRELADRHGLFLIEDACEALGAADAERPAGGLGDAGVHSFYANKMLTTGNGGAITTSHEGLHERLRALRGYSYAEDRFFWHHHLPVNARMSALQAALGSAQLRRLPEILARRRAVAEGYELRLAGIDGLTLPSTPAAGAHAWWMYTVHVEPEACALTAAELRAALARQGIETRPVFSPLHVQPVLQERAAPAQGPFPVAEWAALTGLNMPTSARMGDDDLDRVCGVVRRAFGGTA